MEKEKYIAYVGTYTHGSSIGIHLYDVDVEEGTLRRAKSSAGKQFILCGKIEKRQVSVFDCR